jgi:putative ABC transport system permease protein
MAIMVDSFRESLDAWLDQVLPADLYLRARDLSPLTAAEVESLAATPGIARLRWQRQQNLLLDERQPPVTLLARFVDADGPAGLPMVAGGAPPRAELPVAWISEAVADLYGFRIGEAIALPLAGRRHAFVVAGVWRDYARQHGTIAISLDAYRALTGDARVTDAAVWLAAGEDAQRMAARLRERLGAGERLEIGTPGEIRAVSLRLFDRSFAVTYALEAVAIVIGLAGVAASFGALAAARRREFGMLRHLGMTRAQIGAMLAGEGALTAALGVAAGLLAGGAIGTVLIRVVNRQSFHWSMELALPVGMLAALALAMVALAALVSVVAARRAMQVEAVRAVREDW